MLWSILPCSGPEERIDPNATGFFERVAHTPQDCHFTISYFPADGGARAAAVGCVICLPDDLFGQQFQLWQRLVVAQHGVRFAVTLSFLGFRSAGAQTVTPTVEEWTGEAEKPVIGTGVKISFERPAATAGEGPPRISRGRLAGLRRTAKHLFGSCQ